MIRRPSARNQKIAPIAECRVLARSGHSVRRSRATASDPIRTSAIRPKARLANPIRQMLLLACTACEADHVEKSDLRSDDITEAKPMELDTSA